MRARRPGIIGNITEARSHDNSRGVKNETGVHGSNEHALKFDGGMAVYSILEHGKAMPVILMAIQIIVPQLEVKGEHVIF